MNNRGEKGTTNKYGINNSQRFIGYSNDCNLERFLFFSGFEREIPELTPKFHHLRDREKQISFVMPAYSLGDIKFTSASSKLLYHRGFPCTDNENSDASKSPDAYHFTKEIKNQVSLIPRRKAIEEHISPSMNSKMVFSIPYLQNDLRGLKLRTATPRPVPSFFPERRSFPFFGKTRSRSEKEFPGKVKMFLVKGKPMRRLSTSRVKRCSSLFQVLKKLRGVFQPYLWSEKPKKKVFTLYSNYSSLRKQGMNFILSFLCPTNICLSASPSEPQSHLLTGGGGCTYVNQK